MNDPTLDPDGGEALAGVEGEISTSNEAPTTVPPAASISRMQAPPVPAVARMSAVSRRSFSPATLQRDRSGTCFEP